MLATRQVLYNLFGSILSILGLITSFYPNDTQSFGIIFFSVLPDRVFSGLAITLMGLLLVFLRIMGKPMVLVIFDILLLSIFSVFLWSIVQTYPKLPLGVSFAVPVVITNIWLLIHSIKQWRHCKTVKFVCSRDCYTCTHEYYDNK